jgi:arginase
MLNPGAIRDYSLKLADAVGAVLSDGEFPAVLGGDCSILLGNLLALRRRARHGLLFIDGHADFYQPEANVNGEVASSELALATGRGPEVLAAPAGYRPLVRDEDVVAFGIGMPKRRRTTGASRCPNPSARSTWRRSTGSGPKPRLARRWPISSGTSWPGSGSISTPTHWTMT